MLPNNVTYTFVDGVLTVFEDGIERVIQPHNPSTGHAWANEEEATAWYLEVYNATNQDQANPAVSIKPFRRLISHLAWFRRFTMEEHIRVKSSTATDPITAVMMERLKAAKFVDLDDPEVIAGTAYLVTQGALTEERKHEILSAPVQPDELP